MKCELCRKSMSETFLKKIVGTHVKDSKGKKHIVCNTCQKSSPMQEIKQKLNTT